MTTVVVETILTTSRGKYYDCDLGVTQDGEFHGLLEKTIFPLCEGDLPIALLGYSLDGDLLTAHVLEV